MGKIVAMFPGQGSQYVGMAKGLYEADDTVRRRYREANEILGFDIASASFDGPAELLTETKYTQPAIFIHSAIIYDRAAEAGFSPDYYAGHSLGEYTALYAAGVLNFADALTAVGKRAEFMQAACTANPGTMAAVLNLDFDVVREVCAGVDGVVEPANHNSPSQIAISGANDAVATASRILKEKGARRVLPLPVGGAFHSPLMEPAPQQLSEVLDGLTFAAPRVPIVPNVTAEASADPARLKELLVRQITAPVLWYPSLTWLSEHGVDTYVELGPKQVLAGLAKKSITDGKIIGMETDEQIASGLAQLT